MWKGEGGGRTPGKVMRKVCAGVGTFSLACVYFLWCITFNIQLCQFLFLLRLSFCFALRRFRSLEFFLISRKYLFSLSCSLLSYRWPRCIMFNGIIYSAGVL